jgi:hypothetical protein
MADDGFAHPPHGHCGSQLIASCSTRGGHGETRPKSHPMARHEAKYSPSPIVEVISKVRIGDPDPKRICTSHIERSQFYNYIIT